MYLSTSRVSGFTGRGEVLEFNRGLVKNASGYDLRHLFIGSEGTLGLIVEATLQMVSPPSPSKVLLLGVADTAAMMRVFDALRGSLDRLSPVCAD